MKLPDSKKEKRIQRERWQILEQIESWLEMPMIVLAFAWIGLMVTEFVRGQREWMGTVSDTIWIIFVFDFLLRLVIAPQKLDYLKRNWLTALSLILPALRGFRVIYLVRLTRLSRFSRGLRLVRLVSSMNRGMKALGGTMRRRGFGYVIGLTLLITFTGAAGMLAFEKNESDARGLQTYGEALWWTAMIMTTMGTDFWPQTTEGRLLCFLLAIYAFAVFGYVTATIATFFIGRDTENREKELAGQRSLQQLKAEISELRRELQLSRTQS